MVSYLKRIRDDFNHAGITEPWKIQNSCGQKGEQYKISFHITIPGVVFESHKHLKAWFKKYSTKEFSHGRDKNIKRTTQTIWKLGSTPIDWKVYQKGDWRFPMCAKEGSNRILTYDAEMTFDEFQKLSIHYVEPDARYIEVDLDESSSVKRKQPALRSGSLTNEEKERFNLQGNFEWYDTISEGHRIKSVGKSFSLSSGRATSKRTKWW